MIIKIADTDNLKNNFNYEDYIIIKTVKCVFIICVNIIYQYRWRVAV